MRNALNAHLWWIKWSGYQNRDSSENIGHPKNKNKCPLSSVKIPFLDGIFCCRFFFASYLCPISDDVILLFINREITINVFHFHNPDAKIGHKPGVRFTFTHFIKLQNCTYFWRRVSRIPWLAFVHQVFMFLWCYIFASATTLLLFIHYFALIHSWKGMRNETLFLRPRVNKPPNTTDHFSESSKHKYAHVWTFSRQISHLLSV